MTLQLMYSGLKSIEEEFGIFESMVTVATERLSALYFQLPVAELEDAIYRERVYCYELYHQLRLAWNGFDFGLGGEVDKTGHPLFRGGPYAQAKPDLLVHQPGNMARNLACVEVKPCIRPAAEFREDLKKLTWFCRSARYYRGIFLVYGIEEHETPGLDALKAKLRAAVNDPEIDLESISLMHHARVGEQAARVNLMNEHTGGNADKALQTAFAGEMHRIYQRALSEAGYKATRFFHMLHEHGGLQTAQMLIHAPTVSEGYTAQWERKRLDLTVEALIYDNTCWHPLFTVEERAICKKRLTKYEYFKIG